MKAIYGRSRYPGLYGFSVEVENGKINLVSLDGTPYQPEYLFSDTSSARKMIETGDVEGLSRIALNCATFF